MESGPAFLGERTCVKRSSWLPSRSSHSDELILMVVDRVSLAASEADDPVDG